MKVLVTGSPSLPRRRIHLVLVCTYPHQFWLSEAAKVCVCCADGCSVGRCSPAVLRRALGDPDTHVADYFDLLAASLGGEVHRLATTEEEATQRGRRMMSVACASSTATIPPGLRLHLAPIASGHNKNGNLSCYGLWCLWC